MLKTRFSLPIVCVAAMLGFAAVAAQTVPLKFQNGKTITVDLALTPKQQELGLMFRTSLPKDYGMLFVFPAQQHLEFWMKNTWVDLDMVFIDQNQRIVVVYRKVPRSYPETPESKVSRRSSDAQYVLELPSGASDRYHLKKGQKLAFSLLTDKVDKSK